MIGVALLSLLVAAVPLAEDASFLEGQKLYAQKDVQQGLVKFQAAALNPERSGADRAVLFVWIGVGYASLSDDDNAARAFAYALQDDPAVRLPETAPPAAGLIFLRAKTRANSAKSTKETVSAQRLPKGPTSPKASDSSKLQVLLPPDEVAGPMATQAPRTSPAKSTLADSWVPARPVPASPVPASPVATHADAAAPSTSGPDEAAPASSGSAFPHLSLVGSGVMGAGALALVAGGVTGALGAVLAQQSRNLEVTQVQAVGLYDQAVVRYVVGAAVGVAGAGLVAAGGTLFLLDNSAGE